MKGKENLQSDNKLCYWPLHPSLTILRGSKRTKLMDSCTLKNEGLM